MSKKITVLSLLAILLISSGFGCKITNQATQDAMQPITLTYWRVFDGQDAFQDIITKYKALHPFVNIDCPVLFLTRYSLIEKTELFPL